AGAVGAAMNLLLLQRVATGRPVRTHLAVADVSSVLLVVALTPAAYAPGVILLVSMAALYVFWCGGRATFRMLVPTGAVLLAIGLWRQPEHWLPTWIAWLTTSTLGIVPISRMAAVSITLRQRYWDAESSLRAYADLVEQIP